MDDKGIKRKTGLSRSRVSPSDLEEKSANSVLVLRASIAGMHTNWLLKPNSLRELVLGLDFDLLSFSRQFPEKNIKSISKLPEVAQEEKGGRAFQKFWLLFNKYEEFYMQKSVHSQNASLVNPFIALFLFSELQMYVMTIPYLSFCSQVLWRLDRPKELTDTAPLHI